MPIAFKIQQGLPCVFTNLPNLPYGQFFLPIMAVTHTHASTFLSFVVTTKRTAEA